MFYNPTLVDALTEADHRLHQAVCDMSIKVNNYLQAHLEKCYLVNCHSIARAIANHMPILRVVSGRHVSIKKEIKEEVLVTYTIHSWLVTPDDAIIEPYPPSFLSIAPIIIPTKGEYSEAHSGTYIPDGSMTDFMRQHVNTWRLRKATAALTELIKEAEDYAQTQKPAS